MACANPIVHVHNERRLELLSAFTQPAMQEAETRDSERLTRQSGAHRHLQVALLLLVSNRIANPEIATVSHSQRILRALELCSRDQQVRRPGRECDMVMSGYIYPLHLDHSNRVDTSVDVNVRWARKDG